MENIIYYNDLIFMVIGCFLLLIAAYYPTLTYTWRFRLDKLFSILPFFYVLGYDALLCYSSCIVDFNSFLIFFSNQEILFYIKLIFSVVYLFVYNSAYNIIKENVINTADIVIISLLFLFSLLFIVSTSNLLVLWIGVELHGLCAFFLLFNQNHSLLPDNHWQRFSVVLCVLVSFLLVLSLFAIAFIQNGSFDLILLNKLIMTDNAHEYTFLLSLSIGFIFFWFLTNVLLNSFLLYWNAHSESTCFILFIHSVLYLLALIIFFYNFYFYLFICYWVTSLICNIVFYCLFFISLILVMKTNTISSLLGWVVLSFISFFYIAIMSCTPRVIAILMVIFLLYYCGFSLIMYLYYNNQLCVVMFLYNHVEYSNIIFFCCVTMLIWSFFLCNTLIWIVLSTIFEIAAVYVIKEGFPMYVILFLILGVVLYISRFFMATSPVVYFFGLDSSIRTVIVFTLIFIAMLPIIINFIAIPISANVLFLYLNSIWYF